MSTKSEGDTSLTLLERVQKFPADREAWDEFVGRYHPMMHVWCLKWGLQSSDADDVAQDVVLKLLAVMHRFQYDPSCSFNGWLKIVIQNTWNDFCQDRRREPGQLSPAIPIADLAAARAELEHGLEDHFNRDLFETPLRQVAKRVKPVTWEAFRLLVVEGLSGQEGGRRLSIPVAHAFLAQVRVQKLLQHEIPIMKGDEA
jgi:RNA polymerase sigma-70 factor (ECF subfamily)